jgi:hypothetical protein
MAGEAQNQRLVFLMTLSRFPRLGQGSFLREFLRFSGGQC